MRPFQDLVDDLLGDVKGAAVADLELEATSFAMALVSASDAPRKEATEVVDQLRVRAEPHAAAVLRAFALLGPPVVRELAAEAPIALDGVAADVGSFEVVSAHRAVGADLVADVVWFTRPGGAAQSFFLVTAPDDRGAALLGGGMSGTADPDGLEERLASLVAALDVAEFEPVEPATVVDRMKRGAATNVALMSEVSVALAMGMDIAAYALTGDVDTIEGIDWALDETEDDDERANFLLRVLGRAALDGVDVNDPEALGAWREQFADLSPRAQLKALGLPAVASADDPAARHRSDAQKRSKRKAARKARKRNR